MSLAGLNGEHTLQEVVDTLKRTPPGPKASERAKTSEREKAHEERDHFRGGPGDVRCGGRSNRSSSCLHVFHGLRVGPVSDQIVNKVRPEGSWPISVSKIVGVDAGGG